MADNSTVVCVTGASGFLASHIVQQCLAKGWTVHGTVRDVNAPEKTEHLMALDGASDRLKLFQSDLTDPASFEQAFQGCNGVIHTATPLDYGAPDQQTSIYDPAIAGTQAVLDTIEKLGIKKLVLTSSMSAMAPKPDPDLKSEAHWSDSNAQKESGNWYGAAKTDQERMCTDFCQQNGVAFSAICPTYIIGPCLQPKLAFTMQRFKVIVDGGMKKARNDSMSFIDVRDCAAHHVAVYEGNFPGRYMSLIESLHWNDIAQLLAKIIPGFVMEPCDGEPVPATQFDRSRQDSLPVTVRSVETSFTETIAFLQARDE